MIIKEADQGLGYESSTGNPSFSISADEGMSVTLGEVRVSKYPQRCTGVS